MIIRPEIAADFTAVEAVNIAAFPTDAESRLVNQLRDRANPLISLVAEHQGCIVGHILFSPISLSSDSSLLLMGLAPMAVLPDYQRQGIGSVLVEEGLAQCRREKVGAVAVLGHPEFYPKFGFQKSTSFKIRSEYDVPAEVFMLKELEPDYLANANGTIFYHEEFNSL